MFYGINIAIYACVEVQVDLGYKFAQGREFWDTIFQRCYWNLYIASIYAFYDFGFGVEHVKVNMKTKDSILFAHAIVQEVTIVFGVIAQVEVQIFETVNAKNKGQLGVSVGEHEGYDIEIFLRGPSFSRD
jgi:hypothetical protein